MVVVDEYRKIERRYPEEIGSIDKHIDLLLDIQYEFFAMLETNNPLLHYNTIEERIGMLVSQGTITGEEGDRLAYDVNVLLGMVSRDEVLEDNGEYECAYDSFLNFVRDRMIAVTIHDVCKHNLCGD